MTVERKPGRPRQKRTAPFARWFDNAGIHVDDVAKKLGVKRQTVYNLRNGHVKPSLRLAAKIAKLTGGAVTSDSWVTK